MKAMRPPASLRPHRFRLFDSTVAHGSFSREGGVSPAPWASLNVSFGVGDVPEAVTENRERIRRALGLDALVSARQVHGETVAVVREGLAPHEEIPACDSLITDRPGLGLMIQQADCQAVLLHDPAAGVVANIHAGWRGSVANLIGKTIRRMSEDFRCRPSSLKAAISPSLGPCCAEFQNYLRELPEPFHRHESKPLHFDFWAISREQLTSAGVRPEQIEVAEICTVCSSTHFSYRRERQTGRCASVIALAPRSAP